MEHWQTVLIVKGAAGKMTLYARKQDQQWEFYRSSDGPSPPNELTIVHSFPEALALLGQSWKYLTPQYIHPEFKQQCWSHLSKQSGMFDRINWRKACM
ncbi:hypothetical protein ACFP56_12715 [Paenibacillus septentrionalis]|uniref:Uncharacterized protein n=1 Tax=Paenibacillus septentrionalis TaxID=429342 RepID=A0ABW1V4X0_9BACL